MVHIVSLVPESTAVSGRTSPSERVSLFRRALDAGVGVVYFFGAHLYDGVCYAVSNLYSYPKALLIMSAFLLLLSVMLAALHCTVRRRIGWDVLGLRELGSLRDRHDLPPHRIFRRLAAWTLNHGRWWFFTVGSLFLGPPVVAVLLGEGRSRLAAMLLLAGATLMSVVFWVTVWSGVGFLTWNQHVRPLVRMVWPS